jgi:hypothetical protein
MILTHLIALNNSLAIWGAVPLPPATRTNNQPADCHGLKWMTVEGPFNGSTAEINSRGHDESVKVAPGIIPRPRQYYDHHRRC